MLRMKDRSLSQEHFFTLSKDFMCITGEDGYFKEINPAFQEFLGISDTEALTRPYNQYVHPEDRPKTQQMVDHMKYGTLGDKVFENRYISKEGNYHWLRWISVSYHNGMYYGIAHDVTESRRMQFEAYDHQNKLFQIIELVPHPIFLKDKEGRYMLVNQAQAKLFSSTVSELIGRDDSYFIKDMEELEGIKESDGKVLIQRRTVVLPEQAITYLNGERKILYTTKMPYYSLEDEVSILGVSIDMTEIKNAEAELRKINFELDSFVYHASHDLRAPLCSLTGLLNLVKQEKDPIFRDMCVERAKSSVKKLDGFIAELTNLSRNSRMEVKTQAIDFHKLLDDCLDDLKFMEEAKSVEIERRIFDNCVFHSDPGRLRIVLMNLLSNAIKYQKKDHAQRSQIQIEIEIEDNYAGIIITDNGIGIEDEYKEKVFDMFFRASEHSFGSGLGLYIVKQVIERLRGTIDLESQVGDGTTVKLFIPNNRVSI